uniref:Guanine nucleotide-binding protein subunit gamma n=1 Tax=Sinocyclocheilus anshuiensis TaxID=1608454 RepID=A0A671RNA5_9TELE
MISIKTLSSCLITGNYHKHFSHSHFSGFQVSKASADLMRYCGENAKYDPLLMGIPASENPFKDKKPCTIL